MRKILLLLLVAASLLFCGCSMKSNLHRAADAEHLPQTAKFKVGETVDASGFVFEDQSERFSLAEAMTQALGASLAMQGLTSDSAAYVVKTKITGYAPGNAFARWVLPGAGATKLSTESVIYSADNVELARIPVERNIAAGGGYTVGAWKQVFNEVADETANVIKTQLLAPAAATAK